MIDSPFSHPFHKHDHVFIIAYQTCDHLDSFSISNPLFTIVTQSFSRAFTCTIPRYFSVLVFNQDSLNLGIFLSFPRPYLTSATLGGL